MVEHKGQIVGYARVSSTDQSLSRQYHALGDVDRLFEEKVSGKSVAGRTQLQEMVAYVRHGDVVRVKSADRLARSTRELLDLIEQLQTKGVAVEFVDNPALNTSTAQGTFMLTVLGAVAELERAVIRERQAEGIAIAKAAGKYRRAPKLTPDQVEQAQSRIDTGVPKARVARELGVSRQTLLTALAGGGAYASAPTRSPA